MKIDILNLARLSKLEFSEDDLLKIENEIANILKGVLPVTKETAAYIVNAAVTSSNLARYDGVRFMPSAKNAKSIEELYVKTRSEYFDWETKVQIILGNFFMSKGNYEEIYLKARELSGVKSKVVTINNLREDVAKPSLSREEIFSKAPKSDGEYFIVAKVVE